MLPPKRIIVRMERATPGQIKVVWGDATGARWPPYRLYIKPVLDKAEAARNALADLGLVYRQPDSNYNHAIRKLAEKGHELRLALFLDCLPEDRLAASVPSNWLDEQSQDENQPLLISAHADPILPIPWGLLHETGPLNDEKDVYQDFWALRYQVSAVYNGIAPQGLKRARPENKVRLLAALNESVLQATHSHLSTDQQSFISAFFDQPVGKAFTSEGCRKRWEQVGPSDCIILFFGHASGTELLLSPSDPITASRFRSMFRRDGGLPPKTSDPSYVLTILNGCASVSGQDTDNFMVATADPGFCGFIGAETIVPDHFAILFGQELLYNIMIQGLSVQEAMYRLWTKHRPMALFYGCYAQPEFTITPPVEVTALPNGFQHCNYQ